jgi:hypothetical protein
MSFTDSNLPPTGSGYAGQFHCLFEACPWLIRNPSHAEFTRNESPPATTGQTQSHTFGSTVAFSLSYRVAVGRIGFTVPIPGRVSVKADVAVDVTLDSVQPDGTQHFRTALKRLDSAPMRFGFGPFRTTALLKLSERRPSDGRTSIKPRADGRYDVTSHFDVATKLSFDDGKTWHHSENKDHTPCAAPMDLLPDPLPRPQPQPGAVG